MATSEGRKFTPEFKRAVVKLVEQPWLAVADAAIESPEPTFKDRRRKPLR